MLTTLLFVTACETVSVETTVKNFCSIYTPIYLTDEEREALSDKAEWEIDSNNVIYLSLCVDPS